MSKNCYNVVRGATVQIAVDGSVLELHINYIVQSGLWDVDLRYYRTH